jgi:hypothetical protein
VNGWLFPLIASKSCPIPYSGTSAYRSPSIV